jgi:rhamnogalacturonyl hydrolase YesR
LKASAAKLADELVQHFQDEVKDKWRWFEPHLTYDNARLTNGLFVAYRMIGNQKYLKVAEESMNFLLDTQMIDDVFVPIGNDGWYKRGGNRALYDQQPLEAGAMVETAIDAYGATKDRRYLQVANRVFEWFLGRNSKKVMVYNPETMGCCDGIRVDGVNINQGAESSVSYLLARLRLEELKEDSRNG